MRQIRESPTNGQKFGTKGGAATAPVTVQGQVEVKPVAGQFGHTMALGPARWRISARVGRALGEGDVYGTRSGPVAIEVVGVAKPGPLGPMAPPKQTLPPPPTPGGGPPAPPVRQ